MMFYALSAPQIELNRGRIIVAEEDINSEELSSSTRNALFFLRSPIPEFGHALLFRCPLL